MSTDSYDQGPYNSRKRENSDAKQNYSSYVDPVYSKLIACWYVPDVANAI